MLGAGTETKNPRPLRRGQSPDFYDSFERISNAVSRLRVLGETVNRR